MELEQLRCFIVAADQLHFGRAAQKLGMLPASFGRHIKLLEQSLGVELFARTTRSVSLTEEGTILLQEVRPLLNGLQSVAEKLRTARHLPSRLLRIGAIDSAAAGLLPLLFQDFRERFPETTMQLVEDKTIRLIPKLLAGRLDLIFIRPRSGMNKVIHVEPILFETVVVAMASSNPLAAKKEIAISELADEPLIVPERRSRPHSHDLTINLFHEAGLQPRIAQVADEKQTIITLIAAGIGSAVVPKWTSKLAVPGVSFIPLRPQLKPIENLPLAAAWLKDVRDPSRDALIGLLQSELQTYTTMG